MRCTFSDVIFTRFIVVQIPFRDQEVMILSYYLKFCLLLPLSILP
jgi:hypothetical protein